MITILDYGAGNLRSVQRACRALGESSVVVEDPDGLRSAERIIFPGIGAAPAAMENLLRLGVVEALAECVREGVPTLGICIGAQVALDRSEEGDTPCLGLIPGVVRLFELDDPSLKVPHIGWNEVRRIRPHPLLEGLEPGDEYYFVHSYYLDPSDPEDAYAVTDYGGDFCSAIGRGSFFATQFHPEKSGRFGLALLKRFAAWKGDTC
ncbi:MAG: imidazole glycerol phosphate synthase subunit HisH [Deltaproteobacteria bacterium]|nr:imidazole glycerol phosphate synthase subunit HisH [Deltaproteobacteria bacterium]MBW2725373.1 imidazole glycerol phosphate synthase subunit HisH [Deltaproteobacteria bacterium]